MEQKVDFVWANSIKNTGNSRLQSRIDAITALLKGSTNEKILGLIADDIAAIEVGKRKQIVSCAKVDALLEIQDGTINGIRQEILDVRNIFSKLVLLKKRLYECGSWAEAKKILSGDEFTGLELDCVTLNASIEKASSAGEVVEILESPFFQNVTPSTFTLRVALHTCKSFREGQNLLNHKKSLTTGLAGSMRRAPKRG